MSSRFEIRLSGTGGQGLILASVILGRAVALYEGREATQTQSYGPEARGGATKADVIISDEPVDYPKATNLDVLLALSGQACSKYHCDLKPGGILIADSMMVPELPDGDFKKYHFPIIMTAEEEIGRALVANIVSLGIVAGLTGVVSKDSLEKSVTDLAPPGTERINLRALAAGFALAEEARKKEEQAAG